MDAEASERIATEYAEVWPDIIIDVQSSLGEIHFILSRSKARRVLQFMHADNRFEEISVTPYSDCIVFSTRLRNEELSW